MEPVNLISFKEFNAELEKEGFTRGVSVNMTDADEFGDGNDLYKYSDTKVFISYSINRFWCYSGPGEAMGTSRDLEGAIESYKEELKEYRVEKNNSNW